MKTIYLRASSEFLAKNWKTIGLRSYFIDFRPWFSNGVVANLTGFLQLTTAHSYQLQFFFFFFVSPMCMVEKRKDRNLSDYQSEILADNGIVYILGCNVIKIKYGSRWGQSSKGNVGILQPEPWSKHWIRKRDKRSSRTLLWKLNNIEIKYMVW